MRGPKHDSEDGEGSVAAEAVGTIAPETVTSRKQPKAMDDYEAEEKKQAAAKSLLNYSQFVMTCIGEDVKPGQLRLHLLKEISGMSTSLNSTRFVGADRGQTSSQESGTLESHPTVEGSLRGKISGK